MLYLFRLWRHYPAAQGSLSSSYITSCLQGLALDWDKCRSHPHDASAPHCSCHN